MVLRSSVNGGKQVLSTYHEMSASPAACTSLSAFDKLPREIRDMIYGLVLFKSTTLTRTSKAFHEDTKEELLRQHPVYRTRFELDASYGILKYYSFTQPPPKWALSKLQHLNIDIIILAGSTHGLGPYLMVMLRRLVDPMEKPKTCHIAFSSPNRYRELSPAMLADMGLFRKFETVTVRLPQAPTAPRFLGDRVQERAKVNLDTTVATVLSVLGPKDGALGPKLKIVGTPAASGLKEKVLWPVETA